MTVKGIFFGLAQAGGKALNGIGAAATEVLRHVDIPDTQDDHLLGPVQKQYHDSPHGDGRNGVRVFSKPHSTQDVHS